jgi:hypothetical protein
MPVLTSSWPCPGCSLLERAALIEITGMNLDESGDDARASLLALSV